MRNSPRKPRAAASVPEAAPPSTDPRRRRFLFTLGVGTAGAATVVAALPATAAADAATAQSESDAGYRVTTHVRDYYRTTKL
jgi:hypothetical protein